MSDKDITRAVWLTDDVVTVPEGWGRPGNDEWKPANILIDMGTRIREIETRMAAQSEAIDKLVDALGQAGSFDPETLKREIREAIESVSVRLTTAEEN